ncbi:MAG: molybdenum cofactor biosynthesis F family protein [Oscillospiraceae bacterium]|jgi:hypothetical protein|nr:molybdenum cofactor biosynthesis F family protein [Oscillospiraceae bacterium]
MFFYNYNSLTTEEISKKLGQAPVAQGGGAIPSLAGKTLKITLDGGVTLEKGPALEYAFLSDGMLTLSEDGAAGVTGPYRGIELGEVTLFTHLIPGTQRGYNVIIDGRGLVTVVEVWFSGFDEKREVQREVYFGYVGGGEIPEKRHSLTNRVEGKGFHWKDCTGFETLVFYPSVTYSTLVELSPARGGLTIAAPSDYIKIDDRFFIYDRVECEFSGTFTLDVVDLFTVKSAGVRLGFDENDALEYRVFTADGEITGQAATFEPVGDYGTKIADTYAEHGSAPVKGARAVYRPRLMHTDLTKEQVKAALAKPGMIFAGSSIMTGSNNMEPTDYLAGKKFTLSFDTSRSYEWERGFKDGDVSESRKIPGDIVWEYEVSDAKTLKWRAEGASAWSEEAYQAFEPAKDIILFSHVHTGSENGRCVTLAVDFTTRLATCIDAQVGSWRSDWEIGHCAIFGVLKADGIRPPETKRHHHTTELVGKSFTWDYGMNVSSIHVYSTPESYSWTIFMSNGSGGMTWSAPCIYVKLRDDAYLFSWVEEKCNGNQGVMVFNPNIMHDAGYFYGMSENGVSLTTLGAFSRTAGEFDILKHFK